jgi:hypothetical protein
MAKAPTASVLAASSEANNLSFIETSFLVCPQLDSSSKSLLRVLAQGLFLIILYIFPD